MDAHAMTEQAHAQALQTLGLAEPLQTVQTVQLALQGPVLHLTLNRPQQRNAMSLQMVREMQAVLQAAHVAAQAGVRVLVLRGAGGHFCAGADLKDMAEARMRLTAPPEPQDLGGLDAMAQVNAQFGHLCLAVARSPLATVAVLEGTVMGGGMGLACVVDVALAAPSVSFRLPETSLGVVPAQIAPHLVQRLGYSQAMRLAVTGGRLNAQAALAIGLVHEVHGGAALDSALRRVLADILQCAPAALAATKALMAQAAGLSLQPLIEPAARVFSAAAQGPEGQEGTLAFLHKRPPAWALAASVWQDEVLHA